MTEMSTATIAQPRPVERPWFNETRSRGFNFLELLVVLALLGILAGIVVSSVGRVVAVSEVTACNLNANTIDVAAAAFRTENPGIVPTEALLLGRGGRGDLGAPYVQSWPNSTNYVISIAARADRGGVAPGDVLVTVGAHTLNATISTAHACARA